MPTSYPSAADVEALLKSSSYWPTDATKAEFARLQAAIGASAAADEWERVTGWAPFLVDKSVATTREFWDGPDSRGFLDFEGGALEVESVSVNGNALVAGGYGGYRLEPENAASRHKPITGLHLGYRAGFYNLHAQPIVVKALWGWGRTLPADVWQAIQQKAALIALTQIENLQNIASISEDGFTKAFDVVGVVTQKDLVTLVWGKSFNTTAERYVRVVR